MLRPTKETFIKIESASKEIGSEINQAKPKCIKINVSVNEIQHLGRDFDTASYKF